MHQEELEMLLCDLESDRVERKESAADADRIRQAICAFANDLPDHRKPGILFVGAKDDGSSSGLQVTEELLLKLASMRDDGNIVPLPAMTVQKLLVGGSEKAVVVVQPSDAPPVRHKGRVWIRVGPRRAIATPQEERILTEKRRGRDLPYDLHPIASATLDDLNLERFAAEYLPSAVAPEVLEENQRSLDQQLASLRFIGADQPAVPTVMGMLVAGRDPRAFIPGAYIQFVRFDGVEFSDTVKDQKDIDGPVADQLRMVDELFRAHIQVGSRFAGLPVEQQRPDYPLSALQQFIRNAVMHRDYDGTNAPVRVYWFRDRVEVHNPGGPFGQVTRENFGLPGVTDYRNPHLAEAMKNLGYVQRFGVGIQIARKALVQNGNPLPDFAVEAAYVSVTVRSTP
jgi:ATP-dependent DNA helicase RecG